MSNILYNQKSINMMARRKSRGGMLVTSDGTWSKKMA